MSRVRVQFRTRMNPTQWRAWQSQSEWTAFLGGWGAGKTFLGARVFLRNVLENPRGVDSLLAAPFWATVQRTTLRELLVCTPKKLITGQSKRDHFVEILGRRVYYGSADKPETLDGPTVGAVWIDEGRYVKRKGWEVVFSRLRAKSARRVRGVVTSTPGGEWLEDEFGTGKKNRAAVHASTRENAGNLRAGYIEELESSLSKRAARVFIDGQFGLLEGAVYSFEKSLHLIPWTYRRDLPVMVAWDFGWQRPAVLFLQPIPPGTLLPPVPGYPMARRALPGTWVVFDELVPDELSTEGLANQVRAKGYPVAYIRCDPAGDGTQTATGLSDVKVLRAAGFNDIRWVEAPWLRHIPTGVRMVEAALGNTLGETRLYVAKQLDRPKAKRGVVKDLQGYRYPEAKDGRPVRDQPLKDGVHDHSMDALRYFLVGEIASAGTPIESKQVR